MHSNAADDNGDNTKKPPSSIFFSMCAWICLQKLCWPKRKQEKTNKKKTFFGSTGSTVKFNFLLERMLKVSITRDNWKPVYFNFY